MISAPYRYRTLDDERAGYSYERERACCDAARIARETGKTVELLDPRMGCWHVDRISAKRARWTKVEEARAS
jgi:hypothetical protein